MDPFTLDLNGDGINTVGINPANPILFDLDGDGIKTATGWIGASDGLLALDRNGNGAIDDGRELFGDATPLYSGGMAVDGFDAIAQEDSNGDGLISALDAHFADLRVWQDLNQDGLSQVNELKTLTQLGIASISVAKTEHLSVMADGNAIADYGSFTWANGTSGGAGTVSPLADVNLIQDTFHSQFTDTVPLTAQAEGLPEIKGSGQVRSLREAASLSPTLAGLLEQFAAANRSGQLALINSVIQAWSDTSAMETTFTGAYAGHSLTVDMQGPQPGSAEYTQWANLLTIMERFNGRTFQAVPAGEAPVFLTMNHSPRELLQLSYDALRSSVFESLAMQTRIQPLMNLVDLKIDESGIGFDFTRLKQSFDETISADPGTGIGNLLDFNRYAGAIFGTQWEGWSYFGSKVLQLSQTEEGELAIDSISGINSFGFQSGTSSDDRLTGGQGDDLLLGLSGNDTLYGSSGADTLWGGAGNDTLDGYNGSDTYLFGRGDGQDVIAETHNMWSDYTTISNEMDEVLMGDGVTANDVTLIRVGGDLKIALNGTEDVLTVANQGSAYSGIELLRFADGTVWNRGDIVSRSTYQGTAGSDTATGWSDAGNVMYGNGGDDNITGNQYNDYIDGGDGDDTLNGAGSGNDTLIGGAGNDSLTAGNGSDVLQGGDGNDALFASRGADTLSGGAGNDTLDGSDGSDTYLFGRGDSRDLIAETHGMWSDISADVDTVQLGEGITVNDVTLSRVGENLKIALNGTEDVLTINSQSSSYFGIEQLRFVDGTVWNRADIARRTTFIGSGGADNVTGWSEAGNVMFGNGGNDSITGNQYNDYIDGGDGDDTLSGYGLGNDTLIGGAGNDKLTGGNGADVLQGGEGNDTLYASRGADTLSGGAGNDAFDGGDGSDTYLFGRGDGQDTITETHGMYSDISADVDTVELAEGIATTDVTLTRSGNDLKIAINGTSDLLTVTNHSSTYSGIEKLRFADGTVWSRVDIGSRTIYQGSSGNDELSGWSDSGNLMYGNAGNDNITGNQYNDYIDGGDGDDTLSGYGLGNDTLIGG
ncbi:MAG: calcium-binding protein, partial [Betaproteobacteria bacterium]